MFSLKLKEGTSHLDAADSDGEMALLRSSLITEGIELNTT